MKNQSKVLVASVVLGGCSTTCAWKPTITLVSQAWNKMNLRLDAAYIRILIIFEFILSIYFSKLYQRHLSAN